MHPSSAKRDIHRDLGICVQLQVFTNFSYLYDIVCYVMSPPSQLMENSELRTHFDGSIQYK